MSTLNRKIGATLAGSALAATALLSGVPAATASVDQQAHGTPHYKVVFDYIGCHKTEDKTGYDEVYMKFGDHKAWGTKNMDKGDYHRFHGWKKDFKHDFKLSLWDDDYGPKDYEDDYLGHVWVKKHDYDKGWQYAKFDHNGAHYELKYKVVKYWN